MEKKTKQKILQNEDVIAFLDIWFPVIEQIGKVQDYYNGDNKNKVPLVAPDQTGILIMKYIEAQKKFGLKRVVVENENT